MEDKPISVRLGPRRMNALERYLAVHSDETRNGVIAGAVEAYLQETGFWNEASPLGRHMGRPKDQHRPTLSERVARLEGLIEQLQAEI